MANPVEAFSGTVCNGCGETLGKGEELYLTDDGRFCSDCADDEGNVCECGNFKKEEFKTCYDCSRS